MTQAELLSWFEALRAQRSAVPRDKRRQLDYAETPASAWLTEAESALAAAFPAAHPTRRNWASVFENARALNIQARGFRDTFDAAAGVFEAAHAMLRSGRLGALVEGVRAEVLAELLEHAGRQVELGRVAAGILAAGAALEAHLRHLCEKHELPAPAERTLRALSDAIDEARRNGTPVYSAPEARLVADWSALHAAAVESPAEPGRSAAEVAALLEGLRQLVART